MSYDGSEFREADISQDQQILCPGFVVEKTGIFSHLFVYYWDKVIGKIQGNIEN